jgi:hypothetical protein
VGAERQKDASAEASEEVMITMGEKTSEELEQVQSLIQLKAGELLHRLLSFDVRHRSFIEFELMLCQELNHLGATILEQAIPLLYGDGYRGSRVEVDEETSYSCVARKRERGLLTAFGKIKLTRAVYTEYHGGGLKSFLDEQLCIEDKKHCPLITYWSDLLGTIAPFGEASDILNKIRGIKVSPKQVELSTEATARRITASHDEQIRDIVLDDKERIPPVQVNLNLNAERIVYIETDGCQIHTYNGWKECKTFLLFEKEPTTQEEYRLNNKVYYSTMKGAGELKRQLKYHLERYCGNEEVNVVCIGDGAHWIWNMMKELFPKKLYPSGIREILDFYHAIERIGTVKEEICDEETGNRFYDECERNLRKGNIEVVELILQNLRDKQRNKDKKRLVDDNLKYFMKNKERMRYEFFKDQGLCIGSGAIESANKYVVQRRVKLPGMRWKEENVNVMVHLRAEYINGDMDKHYNIETNPLMGSIGTA